MDIEAVKDEVEKSYGFNIKSIDKIKNVYKKGEIYYVKKFIFRRSRYVNTPDQDGRYR